MPAILLTDYNQMIPAWTRQPLPEKRQSDANIHGNAQQAVNILLGAILGTAVFFVLAMM